MQLGHRPMRRLNLNSSISHSLPKKMSWHFSNRLIQDFENSRSSLALEEAFSEACSSDGAPSAPWRLMPTALDDSCSDKMKGTCHRSPFGIMFVPSTDTHGEALLTWFREDSPVRTSVSQTPTATESTARKAASGESLRGSFARYDLGMSSWRTAQISLLGASDECLETWPRWGLMLDGACYPQKILEHGTCDKGSGLLPTLTVHGNYNRKGASKNSGDGLATAIRRMPTLRATDGERGGRGDLRAIIRGRTTVQRPRAAVTEPEVLGGTLSPDWCEWFMGWPIGWTASEPLATDRFRQWLLGHGRRYGDEARDHK